MKRICTVLLLILMSLCLLGVSGCRDVAISARANNKEVIEQIDTSEIVLEENEIPSIETKDILQAESGEEGVLVSEKETADGVNHDKFDKGLASRYLYIVYIEPPTWQVASK